MGFSINKNLITLKCVLFAFLGGVGCLVPFLPLHALKVGLTREEARLVATVAPCFALLGPLIAGPLADKLSVGLGARGGSGRALRWLLAGCLVTSALLYGLLLAVPTVTRFEARRPSVMFSCDTDGAVVLQEKCTEEKTCNHWNGEKIGTLLLSKCRYACSTPPAADRPTSPPLTASLDPSDLEDIDEDTDVDIYSKQDDTMEDEPAPSNNERRKRQTFPVNPPHLCHYQETEPVNMCQAYTDDAEQLKVDAHLLSGTETNETFNEEWCSYPLNRHFYCHVPPSEQAMLSALHNDSCKPVIECDVDDPYDSAGSVLARSQCMQVRGDPQTTFWTYLFLRCLADAFPTAALALLSTACIIATRETSLGRGDVGRQLALGTLGLALLPPIAGLLNQTYEKETAPYLIPFLMFILCMLIAAVILLLDSSMPLSPPEWWWHTACGALALPMSAVRRYGGEIVALAAVLVLLGVFWSALDTYVPWVLSDLDSSDLLIGLTLTCGALPAVLALWWAERLVDYCGHSNLLITAFIFYILRYTGMSLITKPDMVVGIVVCEMLEVFTLSLVWVTAVLYLRHLVPRKYTCSGQALAVAAHFCIGRCIGALIGGSGSVGGAGGVGDVCVYRVLGVCACVVATCYLALYHLLLAPKCRAAAAPPTPADLQGILNNGASNGSYSPLRVYHNERALKGQFRY